MSECLNVLPRSEINYEDLCKYEYWECKVSRSPQSFPSERMSEGRRNYEKV
jgi:hypothetical protein